MQRRGSWDIGVREIRKWARQEEPIVDNRPDGAVIGVNDQSGGRGSADRALVRAVMMHWLTDDDGGQRITTLQVTQEGEWRGCTGGVLIVQCRGRADRGPRRRSWAIVPARAHRRQRSPSRSSDSE